MSRSSTDDEKEPKKESTDGTAFGPRFEPSDSEADTASSMAYQEVDQPHRPEHAF